MRGGLGEKDVSVDDLQKYELQRLSSQTFPNGKYAGKELGEIPLYHLATIFSDLAKKDFKTEEEMKTLKMLIRFFEIVSFA